MVSKYDNQLTGIITAFIVAALAYALIGQLGTWISASAGRDLVFTQRTTALIAVCLNVIPMNYFRRVYHNKSLRGLVMGTMLLAVGWFFWFGRDLLQ